MSDLREERLREMGLTPIWQRRGVRSVPVVAVAAATAADADVPAAILAPATADSLQADNPTVPAGSAMPAVSAAGIAREREIAALAWDQLDPHIAACTACGLCQSRKRTVPGVGVSPAEWMLVGEAPGAEEDARGEPFVGQAGLLLDNMLQAIGRSRTRDIYISNVLKCRPPGNRNPDPVEVARCAPYLERQVALIKPRLIVALGRFAALTLLNTDASIASLRGRVHDYRGVPLIVTYHPAYLLRNLPDKARAWEDLLLARRTFAGLQSGAVPPT